MNESGDCPKIGASSRPRPTLARPLLIGNWADPTILRDGGDYYMTHSAFNSRPALLIWHSQDLKTWRPVCRAVDRQEGSIWAPDLAKHGDRYYIYYPAGGQNWAVWAESIEGPWSEPQPTGTRFIDPGHVADAEGGQYLHVAGGHAWRLSEDGLRAEGERLDVYDGWPIPRDWAVECFCLESPKLRRRGEYYYLTCAQGGTFGPSTSHMVVSARSLSPLGPWENSTHNPVIHTWSRDEPWWSKGHGTLVQTPQGQWFCVFHGIMNGHRSMGRCTLIEPIEWTEDGWFHVPDTWPDGWEEPPQVEMPMSDDFRCSELGIQWSFHGGAETGRYEVGGGCLVLKGRGETAGASEPLCAVPLHRSYEIQTEVEVEGDATAGLMLFASANAHVGLALTPSGRLVRVQEGHKRYGWMQQPELDTGTVALRIINVRQDVRFYWRTADGPWQIMQPSVDVADLGAIQCALFASGRGQARFRYFRYRPLESWQSTCHHLKQQHRIACERPVT
jgi:beta-xylosidase